MQRRIHILYIGMKHDYGDPRRGYSYEYLNFFDTLARATRYHVTFFPFDVIMRERGREAMNRELVYTVQELQPDVCFFVLFTDEISQETIRTVTEKSGAVTLNWFGDDHWRFRNYSRYWAPLFHWIITTDSAAVEKYAAIGCTNVIKSQWGFNHFLVADHAVGYEFDVTFVGQVHSHRREMVEQICRAGINVWCWGRGWNNGRLDDESSRRVYRQSRINLNFTDSSVKFGWKPLMKVLITRRADGRFISNSPGVMLDSLAILLCDRRPQIKGRNFEIPGWGGFLLTPMVDNLGEYYRAGEEVATFDGVSDLIDKVRYYLSHDEERERIRIAGQQRTLHDHTYEKRFRDVFHAMRLTT
jgi:spore maturation protein CgeB